MKKGRVWGILAILFMTVSVMICLVKYAVDGRDRELALRKPLTLSDLDELGNRLDPAIQSQVPPRVEVAETAKSAQPETMAPSTLPTRLERSLSTEKLARLRTVSRTRDKLQARTRMTALRIVGSISHVLGTSTNSEFEHIPAAIGYEMMSLGNWESAKRYLWAAVDTYETFDTTQCKFVLGALAWLEDDPEKAARLLQLSCQGEFLVPSRYQGEFTHSETFAASQLLNAFDLCKETDSAALAEHYLARLRTEYPIQAEEYEDRSWVPLQEDP